ncbi:MAG: hypothetical protein QXV63_00365 [Candidatus Aenigmatarchaeota archaeon]
MYWQQVEISKASLIVQNQKLRKNLKEEFNINTFKNNLNYERRR